MNRNRIFKAIGGLLILLFTLGCTLQTPTLKLSIKEMECSFDGPESIPFGEFIIKFTLDEKKPTESGYALVTLTDGKTIEDLQALTTDNQPSWVTLIDGVHEYTAGSHTYSYDLNTVTTAYHGQPLYLACFRANPDTGYIEKIGAFGPIEVEK